MENLYNANQVKIEKMNIKLHNSREKKKICFKVSFVTLIFIFIVIGFQKSGNSQCLPNPTISNSGICSGTQTPDLIAKGLTPGGEGSNSSGVLSLSGGSYVNVTNNANLQTPGDFTYEMWVKPTSYTTQNTYFENGTWAGQTTLLRQDNSTTIYLYISGSNIGNIAYAPTLNVWTHLALIRSGSTITLYADGISKGNFTTTYATSITPTTDLRIGSSQHTTGQYWIGYIDEFRLWNGIALSTGTMDLWRYRELTSSHPYWANLSCEYKFNGDFTDSKGICTGTGVSSPAFAAANFFTYTWTGVNAPAASTNELQTVTASITPPQDYSLIVSGPICQSSGVITTVYDSPQAFGITSIPAAYNASINWSNGTGSGRVIYINTVNSFIDPTDGSNPTANTIYSGGLQCVFNGTGSGPITVTGLTPSTIYYLRIYEYCGVSLIYNTTTATDNPNNFTTLISCSSPDTQASNITVTPTTFTASINWTNGNGGGRVAYINTTNSFTNPQDISDPSVNTIYSSGQQCIFNGTGSGPVTVTGLASNTKYYVKVYEFCSPDRIYNSTTSTNNPNNFTTQPVSGDYRSYQDGNWNNYQTWEKFNGTQWNSCGVGDYPGVSACSTCTVTIIDGTIVTINQTPANSIGYLIVGQGTSGSLLYDGTARSLTVTGDVTINNGASFTSGVSAITTHALSIAGNLTVNGTFDMNTSAGVVVTFTSATNKTISGTGATCDFYSILLNKGTSQATMLEVSRIISIYTPASANQMLTINNGTFKISSASTLIPYYGAATICAGTGRLWLNNSSCFVKCVGAGVSTSAGVPTVNGSLQVTAGTFEYGSGNDRMILTAATAALIIDGPDGTVKLYGGLDNSSTSPTLTITAGNLIVDPQRSDVSGDNINTAVNVVDIRGIVTFTGGKLTIVDPTAYTTANTNYTLDFWQLSAADNFNGGTIQFGDGVSTTSGGNIDGFLFSTDNAGTYYLGNIIISTLAGAATNRQVKCYNSSGQFYIGGDLTINSQSVFDLNGRSLYLKGIYSNAGNFAADVVNSKLILNGINRQDFTIGNYNNSIIDGLEIDNQHTDGVVIGSDINVNKLTINNSRLLNISDKKINVKWTTAAITNNGTVIGSGKIILNGTAGAQIVSGTGIYSNLELNNTSGGATVNGNVTINGTLWLTSNNAFNINGAYTLTFQNGDLPISQGLGLGTITMATTSSLVFGTAGNTAGAAFTFPNNTFTSTPTVSNFTINRINNLSLSNQSIIVSSNLTLTSGLLLLGSNDLTLSTAAAAVSGTPSVNNMVVTNGNGQLKKYFATGVTSAFNYPIGEITGTTEYSPISLNFTANAVAGIIGVRVVNGQPPAPATADYINRYWVFTSSGITTYNYGLVLNYIPDDVVGNLANMLPGKYNASWTQYIGSFTGNQITFSSTLTNSSALLNASTFGGRTGTVNYYRSHQSGDWNTLSTWETSTDPNFGSYTTPAAAAPTSANCAKISIQTTHTVALTSAATAPDLYVDGTLESNSATSDITATGGIFFNAGSIYNHKRNGGIIPTASWNAASTCNILGIIATNPTGLIGTFGNLVWNTTGQTASGIINGAIIIAGNLIVSSGTMHFNSQTVSVAGNVTNNGTINSTSSTLVINGTTNNTLQTISGSGVWTTGTTGRLNALTINNTGTGTAGIVINCNFALQSTLNLTSGTISGSGTITLGIGSASTLTTNVVSGILPTANTAYNLAGITYHLYYGNGATEYTTGGELPDGTLTNAQAPVAGYIYLANSGTSVYSTVKLSRDGTIAGLYLYNADNSVLRLNGKTLQFSGGAANSNYLYNQASIVSNLRGLDASVSGSTLSFIAAGPQYIYFGNQTFSSVLTKPNVVVSNTHTTIGADLYSYYLLGGGWSINNLTINTGGYFLIANYNLNVAGNIVNNGTIFSNGANTSSTVTMNGTVAQTISGSGSWNQITTNAGTGRFPCLTINNTSGLTPAVSLNQSFALQNNLTLTNGILGGSGTLTLGIGAASTLTMNRTAGSISGLTTAFNLSNVTFNVNYGNGTAISNITTGTEIPYDPTTISGTFTLNNPTNGMTLSNNVTLGTAGVLTLTNGILQLGNNNFKINNAVVGAISGGTASNFVATTGTGQLVRAVSTTATQTYQYPIGDISGTTDYSNVTLLINSNSIQRLIGVRVVDLKHPNDATVNNYISRYWRFTTDTETGTYNYTLSTYYSTNSPTDLIGTQGSCNMNRWNGTDWTEYATTYPGNGFTMTGFNQTNAPLGNSEFTARVNTPWIYTWNQTGTADWTVATNWTPNRISPFSSDILQFNNGATTTATNIPAQTIGALLVAGGTNISLQASATSSLILGYVSGQANVLSIDGTSTLQLSSTGAITHTLGFANISASTTNINGNIIINANTAKNNNLDFSNLTQAKNTINGTISNSGGIVTATTATTKLSSTGIYIHNRDGGAIPTPSWDKASLCTVTGIISSAPTGFAVAQTFGKFTWNCTNQTADISLALANSTYFGGDFSLISSGSTPKVVNLTTAAVNIYFGISAALPADLIIQGGILSLNNSANASSFNLYGNYNQTGGTLNGNFGSTGVQVFNFANTSNKSYTQSAGTVINTNYITYNVNLSSVLTLLSNFPNVGTGRTFTVNGTLNSGDKVISGAGTFVLNNANTATLSIGSVDGITLLGTAAGNVQTTGGRTYGAVANYIYNGVAAQNTGTALTNCTNLTINNSSGVTLSVAVTLSASGVLTLSGSILKLFNFDLNLLNPNNITAIAGTFSASNMIATNGTGSIVKTISAGAQSLTFPLGDIDDIVEYSPCTFVFTSTAAGTLGCKVTNADHPSLGAEVVRYLKRYWSFKTTGMGTYQFNLSFNFKNEDIIGTGTPLAYIYSSRWNGTSWRPYNSTDAGNILNIISIPLNQTTCPLNGSDFTGRQTELMCSDMNILLCESFDGGALPAGWTNTAVQGTQTWLFKNSSPTFKSTSGGTYTVFDDWVLGAGVAPNQASLISPSVNCSNRQGVKLSFNTYWFGVENTHGYVEVSNNNGTSWNIVEDFEKTTKGSETVPFIAIYDITAYAAGQSNVKVRFRYTDGGQTGRYWYIDDIKVYCDPDVSVQTMVKPIILPCNTSYGSSEDLTVRVWNYGIDPIFDVPITSDITGGLTQTLTNTIFGFIASQSYVDYTFPTQVDLSADAVYNINTYTQLATDNYLSNDTLLDGRHQKISHYPFIDNFDGSNSGWLASGTNTLTPTRRFKWGTLPYLNGPQGQGKSFYVESTTNGVWDDIWVESPVFDFSNVTKPMLSMDIKYQLSTNSYGYFQVQYQINGGTWYQLGNSTTDPNWYNTTNWWSNNNASPVNTWTNVGRDLCELSGESCVKFRVYGIAYFNTAGNYYFAVDNFRISAGEQDDVEPITITSPASGKCTSFSANEPIKVLIKNNKCRPIINMPISVQIDGGAIINEVVAGTIPRFGAYEYTFTTTANLSDAGSHTIVITTNLSTDGVSSNNVLTETRNNLSPITIASGGTYFENFNSGSGGWNSTTAAADASRYFRLDPLPYLNGAEGKGDSWYTETNTHGNWSSISLESPVFNLTNTTNPVLYMNIKYQLGSSSYGYFHVEYSANGGAWTQLGTSADPNWYLGNTNWWTNNQVSPVNDWTQVTHSLCNLTPAQKVCLRLRITGIIYYGWQADNNNLLPQTDYSNYSYFAMDDFEITDSPDAGVAAITEPNIAVSGCLYSAAQNITVTVKNFGCNTITDIPVSCEISGQVSTTLTGTVPSIPGNSSVSYTFPVNFNMTAKGTYNFHAKVDDSYDSHLSNNATDLTIYVNYPKINSYPYLENFNTNDGDWVASGANPPANNGRNFAWGTLPYLNGADGNGKSWYIESTVNGAWDNIWLESPVFDLSLISNPQLSMDIKYQLSTASYGYLQVQYSVNGGNNWYQLGKNTDPNWYVGSADWWTNNNASPVNVWTNVNRDLCKLAGEPCVKFRISGVTYFNTAGNYYFALDNFSITGETLDDVEPIAITLPTSRNCPRFTSTETVQVLISNNLCRPVRNIPLTLIVDGVTIATETYTGLINRFESGSYTFAAKANLYATGNHTITVTSGLASDIISANNSYSEIRINNKISTYPFIADFNTDNNGFVSSPASDATRFFKNKELPYLNGPEGQGKSWFTKTETHGNWNNFYIESPVFDLSIVNNPLLLMDIKYQLGSSSYGYFHVEYSVNGAAWTQLGTSADPNWYVGSTNWWTNNQSTPVNVWTTVQKSLTAFIGTNCIKFRIYGLAYYGAQPNNSFLEPQVDYSNYSYFAFDNFKIVDAIDVGVTQIKIPDATAVGCLYSANQTAKVRVYNWSSNTAYKVPVECVITHPDLTKTILSGDTVASIPAAGYYDFTFSQTFDMTAIGNYRIVGRTTQYGDPGPANDSTVVNINVLYPRITSYPYSEAFETNNGYWLASGANPPNNNGRNFVCGTLPYLNGAEGNGKSWYIESTVNGAWDNIWLESPVFDFTNLSSPVMSMDIKYQLSTASYAYFQVQYSLNGGGTWTQLGTSADPDWYKGSTNWWTNNTASPVNVWTKATHNLCSFAGQPCVKFRISGIDYFNTAGNYYFAVDNFKVTDNYKDASVTDFVTPITPEELCTFPWNKSLTVKVKSISCSALNDIPVYCDITGPYGTVYNLTGTVPSIPANGIVNFTFPVTVDLRKVGIYNFDAYTILPGDNYSGNDHKLQTINVKDTLIKTYPYYTNFNNSNQYWRTGNSQPVGSQTRNFVRGVLPYLNGAETRGKSWYVETTTNGSWDYLWLESPIFDFTSVTNPVLAFETKYQLSTLSYAYFHVEYSLNGGQSWTQLGTNADPLWYSGNTNWWTNNTASPVNKWTTVEHNLCALKGQSCVKLRIYGLAYFGTAGNSYFAVDNIQILDSPVDAELTSIYGCFGSTYKLETTIKNKNTLCNVPSAITSIDMTYTIDGGAPVTNTISSIYITAGNSSIVYIPNILIPDPTSTVKVWLTNPNGVAIQNTLNDTLSSVASLWPHCNDHCSNAIELTETVNLATHNVHATIDPSEDPSFGTCNPSITKENTTWYYFTSNSCGGAATVAFKNINCTPAPTGIQISIDKINSGGTPCNPADYTNVFCSNNGNQNDVGFSGILSPDTRYYITTDGISGNQCSFTIELGGAIDFFVQPATGINVTNDATCNGTSKTLSPIGGDKGGIGQWVWYSNALCNPPSLHTGDTYTIDPGVTGQYWVRVETSCYKTITANAIVTVKMSPAFTTDPVDVINCCEGSNSSFTVTTTGTTPIIYQWEYSSDGGNNYIPIISAGSNPVYSGYTTNQLLISNSPASINNYMYRCKTSNECSSGVYSNSATLTIIPPVVGTPIFTLGATTTRCQGTATITYDATASHTTGITYSLNAASIAGGNTINPATGEVNYAAGWSGTTIITASAAGCNGPVTALHSVTITPTVGTPVFSLGASTSRCQGTAIITYNATSTNSTGITYSLDAASITGGNSINPATGAVSYLAGWNSTSIITASATGCNGPITASHTVTITSTIGTPVFTFGATTSRCQGAATVTYSATASNSTGITYSIDAASLAGSNSINPATGEVSYAATWNGTTVITATAAGCNGPTTAIHTVTINAGVAFTLHPVGVSINSGDNTSFSVTATGNPPLSYQWQVSTDGGLNYTNISAAGSSPDYSGFNTTILSVNNCPILSNNYSYKCIVSNVCGSLTSNSAILNISGGVPGLWVGRVSSDWNTNDNWDTYIQPDASINVTIRRTDGTIVMNQPDIYFGNTGLCKNIIINAGASVAVHGTLTVTNSPGNGNMTIKSDATGTGAFLQTDDANITIPGNVNIERYIPSSGYHYLSSPLSNVRIKDGINGFSGSNLVPEGTNKWYNPDLYWPSNTLSNIFKADEAHTHAGANQDKNCWKYLTETETLQNGLGYALFFTSKPLSPLNITKSGNNLNTGDISCPITKTAISTDNFHLNLLINDCGCAKANDPDCGGTQSQMLKDRGTAGNGWNLVGNPYPSPIDWNAAGKYIQNGGGIENGSDIGFTIAFFKSTTAYSGVYGYYSSQVGASGAFNPSRYIPVMQSFYIKNSGTAGLSPQLTFKNSFRSVSNDAMTNDFYKKSDKCDIKFPYIKIKLFAYDKSKSFDETVITFMPDVSDLFNFKYDADKLMNSDIDVPNIYSCLSENNYAVKSLPIHFLSNHLSTNNELIIPLGFSVFASGKYKLFADNILNMPADVNVFLEDKEMDEFQNLTYSPYYSFTAKSGDNNNRLFLHFSMINTKISNITDNNYCNIYSSGQNVFVTYRDLKAEKGILSILNVTGQYVTDNKIIRNGSFKFKLDVATGTYFIKIITNSKVYFQKVYLTK